MKKMDVNYTYLSYQTYAIAAINKKNTMQLLFMQIKV